MSWYSSNSQLQALELPAWLPAAIPGSCLNISTVNPTLTRPVGKLNPDTDTRFQNLVLTTAMIRSKRRIKWITLSHQCHQYLTTQVNNLRWESLPSHNSNPSTNTNKYLRHNYPLVTVIRGWIKSKAPIGAAPIAIRPSTLNKNRRPIDDKYWEDDVKWDVDEDWKHVDEVDDRED